MLSIPSLQNTVHSAIRLAYFCFYNIKNQTIAPCVGSILEVEKADAVSLRTLIYYAHIFLNMPVS